MMRLHSYIVRYDSGFAPNPFFGFCTLATCKPDIRRTAQLGDWIIGTASNDRKYRRGGHLVYAMRVVGDLTFPQYWNDQRFRLKKPNLRRSKMYACGDNIYSFRNGNWRQLNSFHSNADGTPNVRHIARDTGTNRILFSDDFVYFGGEGPPIPKRFRVGNDICMKSQGRKAIDDQNFIREFEAWLRSLEDWGYTGRPLDWITGQWK